MAALIRVGFEIAVICPSGSPVKNIRSLNARYRYRSWQSLRSIKEAIADWKPSLLVCNDDVAVRELHRIHSQARIGTGDPESANLIELIESSLGNSQSFAVSRSKCRLIAVAKALNIPCPDTIVVNSHREMDQHFARVLYPVLIKLDESWGGRGVRLVHNRQDLLRAVLELSFPHTWPASLKRMAARSIQRLTHGWRIPLPQNISIQDYVLGRPANRAVVCWQGRILAGISVEAVETSSQFGPTTLAKILDHGEVAVATEKIVANQNLSGFLGFDFMLDHNNRAWFLEINPRATPTCHLRFKGPSLPASLFAAVTGKAPQNDVREVPLGTIAVFPNRVSKESLHSYFDDVPAEEDFDFIEAMQEDELIAQDFEQKERTRCYSGRPQRQNVRYIAFLGKTF